MSFKSHTHACPECGVKHSAKETRTCDASGCTVESKSLPYYIVARPPWGGEDGTELLHACSVAHVRAVVADQPKDYEIEIEADRDAMLAILVAAPDA